MHQNIDSRWERLYRKRGFEFQRKYPNEALIRFAKRYFPKPRGKRVLVLGCGAGSNLWMLAQEGFQAHGIDASASAIRLCKIMLKHYNVRALLTVGNFFPLPHDPGQFDAIIDVVSLQHLSEEKLPMMYKEIWRCLKPGGRFFSWHTGHRTHSKNKKRLYIGMRTYARRGVTERMLRDAGFKNVDIEEYTRKVLATGEFHEFFSIHAQR